MTDLEDLPGPEWPIDLTVLVAEIGVDNDNPNEMSDEQYSELVSSIRQDGWLQPILVKPAPEGTDTEYLIADGEHRWRAAKDEIGLERVPALIGEDWSEAQRRLVRQRMNKIHGEHDTKRDALEFDWLADHGKRDEVLGLLDARDESLDEYLGMLQSSGPTQEPPAYDVEHNVYLEDCIEGMRERVEDDSVDMVFTSPPYNVEKSQGGTRDSPVVEYTDDREPAEFRQFLGTVFDEIARVLKPDGHAFINIQVDNRDGVITPPHWIAERMPLPWRSYIIWDKNAVPHGTMGANRRGRFYLSWEPIYHFSGEEPRELNGTRNFGVWNVGTIRGNELYETDVHPAPFPVELVTRAIDATTQEGDLVLDPFMGSGTSAVAAIQKHRDYVGFELDEEGAYKPIIDRRIRDAKRQTGSSITDETEEDAGEEAMEADS